jgi:hypothetical protein
MIHAIIKETKKNQGNGKDLNGQDGKGNETEVNLGLQKVTRARLLRNRGQLEIVIPSPRNCLLRQGEATIQQVVPRTAFSNWLGAVPEGDSMLGLKKREPKKSWLDFSSPQDQTTYVSADAILKNCINSV